MDLSHAKNPSDTAPHQSLVIRPIPKQNDDIETEKKRSVLGETKREKGIEVGKIGRKETMNQRMKRGGKTGKEEVKGLGAGVRASGA